MMRKLFLAVTVIGIFCFTPVLTGCSDSDVLEEEEHSPSDEAIPDIPPEVLDKVHEIYDNASTGPQTVTTVHQLAILTSVCATHKGDGPISVTPAVLNEEEVTLVTLGGTEDVEGQATTVEESKLASFGTMNDYLKALLQLFSDGTIPKNKPVLLTGISLGGMIAQQLLGQEEILNSYTIRAVITFGSPLTLPLDRQGVKVVRFADVHDQIPKLGETVLRSGMATGEMMDRTQLTEKLNSLDAQEKIVRTSKYTGMIETHALSYIEDDCWNDIDFLGDTEKKNVLVLKEPMKFYHAPKTAHE